MSNNLLLVGCGKMGRALLSGWKRADKETVITVIDPAPQPADTKNLKSLSWLATPDKIPATFTPDAIIIAIKPQQMALTLPAYARFQSGVFLSIAAGQTIAHMSKLLGSGNHAIIRAMPNLPASIGAGISVAVANAHTSPAQFELAETLLRAGGEVAWIEDENLLDAVTALSGSGPAYVFALVEAMATAGEKLGLTSKLSYQLARQTIIGSGTLLAQSTESAASLRQNVTSPGGTTEAALSQLLANNGLMDLMFKTMQAAAKRAKELAN